MTFSPEMFPPKQTFMVLALFFLCTQFLSYRNHLTQDSDTGQMFVGVAFVPVISLLKQKTLVMVPFLSHV
jgi:hypothetical protein